MSQKQQHRTTTKKKHKPKIFSEPKEDNKPYTLSASAFLLAGGEKVYPEVFDTTTQNEFVKTLQDQAAEEVRLILESQWDELKLQTDMNDIVDKHSGANRKRNQSKLAPNIPEPTSRNTGVGTPCETHPSISIHANHMNSQIEKSLVLGLPTSERKQFVEDHRRSKDSNKRTSTSKCQRSERHGRNHGRFSCHNFPKKRDKELRGTHYINMLKIKQTTRAQQNDCQIVRRRRKDPKLGFL